MDISVLKSRLSALQNPRGGQKKDLSQTIWRPTVGKHSVRIVPSKFDKQNPFKEVLMHYGINNRTMMSLANFSEKDPIVEFAQQLRKTSDKENWSLAKKIEPKMRVFVPVIVDSNDPEHLKLTSDHMIPVLVNAVKELSEEVDVLKSRLDILENS